LIARAAYVVKRRRLAGEDVSACGMALQTEGAHGGAHEHLRIVGPVGFMTRLAIPNSQRGMFEDKRSGLIGVTLHASGLPCIAGPELAAFETSMWLVTIDAAHGVFGDAMVERFGEIGAALHVAAQAQVVGRLLQQPGKGGLIVDAVTVGAGKAGLRVHARSKTSEFVVLFVAAQALLAVDFCALSGEGEDLGFVTVAGGVGFAGAVTGLARVLEIKFWTFLEDGVGSLVESFGEVLVADGTVFIVYVYSSGFGRLFFLQRILGA
jgi:hypothetical protein